MYAFIDAGLQVIRAFSSPAARPVLGHLLLAIIEAGAGIFAIAWLGATALVLVLIVAVCAFFGLFAEIFAAFGCGETASTRAILILAGLVSVAFGVVPFARPGVGAASLALLFGLFSLVYGGGQIATGFDVRRLTADALPGEQRWEENQYMPYVRRISAAADAVDAGYPDYRVVMAASPEGATVLGRSSATPAPTGCRSTSSAGMRSTAPAAVLELVVEAHPATRSPFPGRRGQAQPGACPIPATRRSSARKDRG